MKYNYVTNALCTALLLFGSMAVAETKYPAADFQPKVIYQDEGYQHSQSSASSSTGGQSKSVTVDPKYPAANFQPQVLYQDTGYKHQKPAQTSSRRQASAGSAAKPAAEKSGESSNTFLIGILILAVVGYFLYNQGSKGKTAPKTRRAAAPRRAAASRAAAGSDSGATGVARYLAEKQGGATTGVAKYLESLQKEAPTGVAKYMAKKVVSARKAAAEKVTGVEKYLREKG